MIALATERLALRPWRDDDLPAFARLNDDAEVTRFMPRGLWAVEAPGGDFGHPAMAAAHPLRAHVLYRLSQQKFATFPGV